ncbi:hypothetical protein [Bosea sp. (in: a-proteobacteria)]|uniref:hypothetical protein n=1 Tax=Bosea sp. (in: a-proteobacteria) TaxID=1871050 RepID=UPI002637E0D6|nr:hypothetical protein [Bosea sp. (in: a-proteobacteria)]MCO5092656.1 hypothetical protein [Bosea sp. (in: a-proteobacteria)]
MNEDDNLPTEPAAESAAPAESEKSEAETKVVSTEEQAETETEADSAADDGEDGDDDSEGEKPKRPSRYQRLKRERDALAAKLAQQESRPLAAAADDKAALDDLVRREVGEPPNEEDFNGDWFAYERALTAYETEKRIATRDIRRQAQQAQQTTQEAHRELLLDYQERQREARASINDFEEVMKGAASLKVSHAVGQLLLESEKSAVIEYHLAKNPALLDRLNAMSPLSAAKEIGRLEDRLSLPNPKTATKAAPPIKAPKGGASPVLDLSKMSMEDYVAHRNKGAA